MNEVKLKPRPKYLHHQVKKVTAPKGGSSGTSKKKRHPAPGSKQEPVFTGIRMLVLESGSGRRRWTWV